MTSKKATAKKNRNDGVGNYLLARKGLLPSELSVYKKSIRNQIETFSKFELINLIQIGHVAVDLSSIKTNTFAEKDVYILFSEFGPSLGYLINEWNLAWIIGFKYFHCDVYPTHPCDEDNPLANPRWNDIVSLSRSDLLEKLDEFMYPMFTDAFEATISELLNGVRRDEI